MPIDCVLAVMVTPAKLWGVNYVCVISPRHCPFGLL